MKAVKKFIKIFEQKQLYQSPLALLVIVVSVIFISETTVMIFLSELPSPYVWEEALFDSALLIFILFPALYFLIFRRSRMHIAELSKTNQELQIQIAERKKAEEACQQSENHRRILYSRILTAHEEERKRISMELHDELGQSLSVLKLRLGYIERKLECDQEALRREFKETLQYIDQVVENVRRLSKDLSPSILVDLGLTTALRRLINEHAKLHQVRVYSRFGEIDHLIPQRFQIVLYRIFQEALTNMGKYAQARNVSVEINEDDGMISFLLEDDGKGFDVTEFLQRNNWEKGLGLGTMSERAWMMGGTLNLNSQEGRGTRISFSIPIERGKS